MDKEKGHSLVELMIVLSVLSLITVIVIPNFVPISETKEIDQFLEQLQEDIYFTQALALSRGQPAYLRFTSPNYYYRIYTGNNKIMLHRNYPRSILIEYSPQFTKIEYNHNGNISKIGKIFVRTKKGTYTLTFQLGKGRFHVAKL